MLHPGLALDEREIKQRARAAAADFLRLHPQRK
jgi:hypothetical protein